MLYPSYLKVIDKKNLQERLLEIWFKQTDSLLQMLELKIIKLTPNKCIVYVLNHINLVYNSNKLAVPYISLLTVLLFKFSSFRISLLKTIKL